MVVIGLFLYKRFPSFSYPEMREIPPEVEDYISKLKPLKTYNIPILMYHYVEFVKDPGDTIRKSLAIIPPLFEQEVITLKKAGFTFMTMAEVAEVINEKVELPQRAVVLTFDDGYRDFYTDVFPILRRNNVKATVYIVNNFLDLPNNLTRQQLLEIGKSGLVDIGAHTMNHSYLAGLSLSTVKFEVEQSKKDLEKLLGTKVTSFAYPYGAFDNQAVEAVKNAGFDTAVTTILGRQATNINRYFLFRIRPGGRIGEPLLNLLQKEDFSKAKVGF